MRRRNANTALQSSSGALETPEKPQRQVIEVKRRASVVSPPRRRRSTVAVAASGVLSTLGPIHDAETGELLALQAPRVRRPSSVLSPPGSPGGSPSASPRRLSIARRPSRALSPVAERRRGSVAVRRGSVAAAGGRRRSRARKAAKAAPEPDPPEERTFSHLSVPDRKELLETGLLPWSRAQHVQAGVLSDMRRAASEHLRALLEAEREREVVREAKELHERNPQARAHLEHVHAKQRARFKKAFQRTAYDHTMSLGIRMCEYRFLL